MYFDLLLLCVCSVIKQGGVACVLPTQVALGEVRGGTGGVSSFGYSGTIAHAVLAFGSGGGGEALA